MQVTPHHLLQISWPAAFNSLPSGAMPNLLQHIETHTSAALKAEHVVQAGAAHVDEEECTCEASIVLPLDAPRVLLLRLAEQAAADALLRVTSGVCGGWR